MASGYAIGYALGASSSSGRPRGDSYSPLDPMGK